MKIYNFAMKSDDNENSCYKIIIPQRKMIQPPNDSFLLLSYLIDSSKRGQVTRMLPCCFRYDCNFIMHGALAK